MIKYLVVWFTLTGAPVPSSFTAVFDTAAQCEAFAKTRIDAVRLVVGEPGVRFECKPIPYAKP